MIMKHFEHPLIFVKEIPFQYDPFAMKSKDFLLESMKWNLSKTVIFFDRTMQVRSIDLSEER